MSVKGTLVEDKRIRFKSECAHFSFNKYPIYTNDGASAKFSTNSHKTDNRVVEKNTLQLVEKKGDAGIFVVDAQTFLKI